MKIHSKKVYLYCYITLCMFFTPLVMVAEGGGNWTPSCSKSSQLFKTLLSILDDLSSAMVCMVSILPRISSYPILFSRLLGIVPSTLMMIGITVTFIFYNFLNFLAGSRYFLNFFVFLYFNSLICWNSKVISLTHSFFLFIMTRYALLNIIIIIIIIILLLLLLLLLLLFFFYVTVSYQL